MRPGIIAVPAFGRKGSVARAPFKLRLTIGEPRNFASVTPGKEGAGQIAMELQEAVRRMAEA